MSDLVGGVIIAALTYWLTKRKEREAEWRKEKLANYKEFVDCLSGIVAGDDTPEGHRKFAKATNNLLLFAPQLVIEAMNAFRIEIAITNTNRSQEKHDQLLAELLLAIRKDVGISPKDKRAIFRPILWSSGVS